jgi:hypothetical protein
MRVPSWTILLLAASSLVVAACGSVTSRAGTGGMSGSDAGTGGSGAGGSGSGGTTGAGGSASGGMTGSMGGAGGSLVDAGPGDGRPSDGPSVIVRGAVTPFGVLAPASGATVHVTHQSFGPTFACSGNVCFRGGLLPP